MRNNDTVFATVGFLIILLAIFFAAFVAAWSAVGITMSIWFLGTYMYDFDVDVWKVFYISAACTFVFSIVVGIAKSK